MALGVHVHLYMRGCKVTLGVHVRGCKVALDVHVHPLIDPLPRHPRKDQNISGHIVLAQNVCVIWNLCFHYI